MDFATFHFEMKGVEKSVISDFLYLCDAYKNIMYHTKLDEIIVLQTYKFSAFNSTLRSFSYFTLTLLMKLIEVHSEIFSKMQNAT
jgi:hypothetical protein